MKKKTDLPSEPAATEAQPQKKPTRKERRLERKRTEAQQLALEKQLVREGKILPRTRYAPKGYFGRVLAVMLAFIFGIFVTIGAILGGGYLAGTRPVKDVFAILGVDSSQYIEETYSELSILDLVTEVVSDVQNGKFNNLNAIGKYTPVLKEQLENINEQMLAPLGVVLDVDALMNTPFDQLASYAQSTVLPGIELGTLLAVDASSSALMLSLCYGTEGEDYTVDENNEIVMLEGKAPTTIGTLMEDDGVNALVNRMQLGTLLSIDASSSALMLSLCYGTEGEDYTVGANNEIVMLEGKTPTTIGTLTDADASQALIDGVKLGSILSITPDSDPMMIAVCYGNEGTDYEIRDGKFVMLGESKPVSIGDLTSDATQIFNDLEVAQLLQVGPASEAALRYLAYGTEGVNYRIVQKDGQSVIEMLPDPQGGTYRPRTLGDLTAEDADLLGRAKIGDLVTIDETSSVLMQTLKTWTIGDLSDPERIGTLKIGELITIDDTSSGLLRTISDWTIDELSDQNTFDSIKLGDVISIDETSSNVLQAMSDWTIAELKQQEKIQSLQIRDLVEIGPETSGILAAIADWRVEDLSQSSRIERLKISQIIAIDADADGILAAIADWRVGDLADGGKLNALTLGKVLSIDPDDPNTSQLLAALASARLGDLDESVNSLRLCDFLSEEDLKKSDILYSLRDSSLDTLADDLELLTVDRLFGDQMYSYLDLSAENAKTYEELIAAYDPASETAEVPHAVSIEPGSVRAEYTHADTAVTFGYFRQSGAGYVRVTNENDVFRKPSDTGTGFDYYIEEDLSITPAEYTWTYVDHNNGGALTPLPQNCTVTEEGGAFFLQIDGTKYPVGADAYGNYVCDFSEAEDVPATFAGERIELERGIAAYTVNGERCEADADGNVLIDGAPYFVTEEGNTFLVCIRVPVTAGYAAGDAPDAIYAEDEVSVAYYAVREGETDEILVDRYLSGVWSVLFSGEDGASDPSDMRVTDLTGSVTQMTGKVMTMQLYELYLHEFIGTNPYREIPEMLRPFANNKANLNLLTINETLELVKHLLDSSSSIVP